MAESMMGLKTFPPMYGSDNSKHRSGRDRYGMGAEKQK